MHYRDGHIITTKLLLLLLLPPPPTLLVLLLLLLVQLLLLLLCVYVQFPNASELSAVSCECPTPSTQLRVPVKLQTITSDVQLTARLELNVSTHSISQLPKIFMGNVATPLEYVI